MVNTPEASCIYIALTRSSAEELLWIPLKNLLEKLGIKATFNETKLRCVLTANGSTLRLVGADDKKEIEKLRGRKFHEVAIDEAASFPSRLLDNRIDRVIGPTLGDYRGVLTMFGTPGHDLKGPFYDATRPGGLHRRYEDRDLPEYEGWTSWSSHAWTLLDGAASVPAMKNAWDEALVMKADKQWGDDHPIWSREWLGKWAADDSENVFKYRPHDAEGKDWNQWDPPRVGALRFAKLPDDRKDWEFAIGMDLGHNDPFALEVFAFSPSDTTRTIFHVYEFVKREMYAKLVAQLLLGDDLNHDKPGGVIGHIGSWPAGMVADLAGLGDTFLDELRNVYGIRIGAAEKGYKYKVPAIELFNGDLVEGRLKILKESQLAEELGSLQWVADEFGKLTENRTQQNHATDASVYARNLISVLFESGAIPPAATSKPRRERNAPEPREEPVPRKYVEDDDDDLFERMRREDEGLIDDDLFG